MSEVGTNLNLKVQKRMVKSLMGVGSSRVKFVTDKLEDIKSALTKKDIKSLIKKKIIKINQKKGSSRQRIRKNITQKRKGRRKGIGSRKGKATARLSGKKKWINQIRTQRKIIKTFRDTKLISTKTYRNLYLKSKGGFFRSKRHILTYLSERNLIQKKK